MESGLGGVPAGVDAVVVGSHPETSDGGGPQRDQPGPGTSPGADPGPTTDLSQGGDPPRLQPGNGSTAETGPGDDGGPRRHPPGTGPIDAAGPSEGGSGPPSEYPGPDDEHEPDDPEPQGHGPGGHDRPDGKRTGTEFSLADLDDFVVKEVNGAVARTSVDELTSTFAGKIWDFLEAPSDAGPVPTERLIDALDKECHVILLRDPAEESLDDLEIPGRDFWATIIEHAPIHIIDAPLGSIKRWIEIGGILFGIATGNPAVVTACSKALLHSLLRQFVTEALTSWLSGDIPDRPTGENSARRTSYHAASRSPDISFVELSAPRKDAGVPVPEFIPQPRSAAESVWQAGVPATGAAGFSVSSAGPARPHSIDLHFVRMCIHYDAGGLPDSAQASPLTEVMIVHESSPVRVPGLPVRWAGASAEELEQLIAHQLRASNTTTARHLWYSGDSLGLTGDPVRTDALRANLRRVLLGQRPLDRVGGNLLPRVIHHGIGPHYTRHIDIVAFLSGIPAGRPQVECIGFRVQHRDEFSWIVVTAMDELATAGRRA